MHGVDESRVKLWIEALRSGEFEQANGYLETVLNPDDPEDQQVKGNCCLGVAQHVALRNGWVPAVGVAELDWGAAAMDLSAGKWFGFADHGPFNSGADPYLGEFSNPADECGGTAVTSVYCVEANDDLNWTFSQIAYALEARYITPEDIDKES